MTKVTAVLAQAGYNECRFTKMVFRHETRPITFALVVDDFLIKYSAKADADHLIRALETTYALKTDWAATKYLGIDLTWDYASTPRAVTLSMPGYVEKGVNRFSPWLGSDRKVQHGPGITAPIIYGPPVAPPDDTSDLLPPAEKTLLQALVGYYRYYAEAIDSTILVKLGQLGSQQAQPTQRTKQQASQFLDYCHTWPNAAITFQASDMVLTCEASRPVKAESPVTSTTAAQPQADNSTVRRKSSVVCSTFRHHQRVKQNSEGSSRTGVQWRRFGQQQPTSDTHKISPRRSNAITNARSV